MRYGMISRLESLADDAQVVADPLPPHHQYIFTAPISFDWYGTIKLIVESAKRGKGSYMQAIDLPNKSHNFLSVAKRDAWLCADYDAWLDDIQENDSRYW